MRRRIFAGAALSVLALGVVGVALADTGAMSDPSGDVKHNPPGKNSKYDIVKIAYGHRGEDLLAKVKTKGNIFGPGNPYTPLLWIDVPGKVASRPGCNYSDYLVADGEVQECGEGPVTGSATITKVSDHVDKFVFSPSSIGSPSKYGEAFVEEGSGPNGLVFFDRAPNNFDKFLVHHLG